MERITILALPRSGTTSLSSIFRFHSSKNEFLEKETIQKLTSYRLSPTFDQIDINRFLVKRWEKSDMKVDAASFNFLWPEIIDKAYPNMKYIYLLREPCAWIESFVSMLIYYYQLYGKNNMPQWMTNYGGVYSSNFNWTDLVRLAEDPSCKTSQLIFSDLLNVWIKENSALLKFCNNKRVCYVETALISNSMARLASFAEVLDSTLCLETHANKGKSKQYFLSDERKNYILHQTTKIVREFKKRADENSG